MFLGISFSKKSQQPKNITDRIETPNTYRTKNTTRSDWQVFHRYTPGGDISQTTLPNNDINNHQQIKPKRQLNTMKISQTTTWTTPTKPQKPRNNGAPRVCVNYPSEKFWLWRQGTSAPTLFVRGGGREGNKVSARREEYVIFTWREIEQEMAWPLSSLSKLYYMLLLLLLL